MVEYDDVLGWQTEDASLAIFQASEKARGVPLSPDACLRARLRFGFSISIFFTFGNWNVGIYFNFTCRFFFGLMILDSLNGFCCVFFTNFTSNPFAISFNRCAGGRPASAKWVKNQIAFIRPA